MKIRSFFSCWLLLAGLIQAQNAIPTPESVLGHRVGADFKLASYDESIAYFKQLDAASDRIQLIRVGETSFGRDWYLALISSPENLANLERLREIGRRLAHPGDLSETEARQLAREGKAFVHIDGGLHASEVAAAQHTIELAYNLVSSDASDAVAARILDEVVLLLWPSVNPDGQNIVVNWYRSNLGTPYEVAPLVELYQKYVGHDNNRDAYMLNMIESRLLAGSWRYWEPQIIYVHHQTSPFPTRIWLPPFAEPIASRTPPILSRTVNVIGMTIAQALEARGQVGATHMGTGYDAWYPGYVDYLPMFHHQAAFWTETALYRYATPRLYTVDDFPRNRQDMRVESLYSSPWKGGWWRLRDAVEYMLTASWAVLDYAARYQEELLVNRYTSTRRTIEKYRAEAPFAYVIPAEQRDPVAAVELLRRLAFNGIRVSTLSKPMRIEGQLYAQGTWVIPMDQDFADMVRQLLEVQHYPDLREYPNGPPEQPYDAAGWTLSYMMGVRVDPITAPLDSELRAALQEVVAEPSSAQDRQDRSPFDSVPAPGFDTSPLAVGIVPPAVPAPRESPAWTVNARHNNAFRFLNRALQEGARVSLPVDVNQYQVSGLSLNLARRWSQELALPLDTAGSVSGRSVTVRVGLYRPWTASMDEGWTRWLLERYEFPFTNLRNRDVQTPDLKNRYDVIVLPSESMRALLDGHAEGRVPERYQGGIGAQGVRQLARFLEQGGTLVCMNRSCDFLIDHLALPVRNVLRGVERDKFFADGSILQVSVDTNHPVMSGMPSEAAVFFDSSPAFEAGESFQGRVLARYSESQPLLLSGYLLGEDLLRGRAAALDVKVGRGRVILLGFRPQWRGQTFGTFRVLFNALLFGGDTESVPAESSFGMPAAGQSETEAKGR